jgi:hypothetical protein
MIDAPVAVSVPATSTIDENPDFSLMPPLRPWPISRSNPPLKIPH